MTQLHILVTGTSRGIGAAILAALRRPPRRRPFDRGRRRADRRRPRRSRAPPTALWDEALERLDGRIDVLVNNAGMFEAAPIDADDDDWAAAGSGRCGSTCTASAELCRLAVLHFRERGGGGRIVNVASRAAYRGDSPDHWHYAASKARHGRR